MPTVKQGGIFMLDREDWLKSFGYSSIDEVKKELANYKATAKSHSKTYAKIYLLEDLLAIYENYDKSLEQRNTEYN